MKIGFYQGQGKPTRVDENLEIMRRSARDAVERGAELIIFPELFLTGYNIGDVVFKLAEPADGPAMRNAASIARACDIALLYGYPEKFERNTYNSAILIDRHGNALANYRKTHLFGSYEKASFQPGGALVLAKMGELKIGILICYDVEFPEAVRALVLAGANLIAVPTALMNPYCRIAETVVPTRAYESQVYVAYVNRCGSEGNLKYCGRSCIVGPDGEDIARAGLTEGIFIAEVTPEAIPAVKAQNPMLLDLRPELYNARVEMYTRGVLK
jgi:predicted amidohydrolase